MNKREEVERIDSLIRKEMLAALTSGELETLVLLTPAISYVKANEVTLEKERGSVEKSIESRIEEANLRREKNEK